MITIVSLLLVCKVTEGQALIALLFGGKMKNDRLSLGVYIGGSASWITGAEGQQIRPGLALGAYTVFHWKEKWDLCMYIIMKSPKGARQLSYSEALVPPPDSLLVNSAINRLVTYIAISPLLQYQATKSWAFGIGPQLGVRTRARDIYSRKDDAGILEYQYNIKEFMTRLDAALTFDVRFTLMKGEGIRLNLQYNMGLTNCYKKDAGKNGRQQQLLLGAGIPIGHKQ